MGSTEEFKSHIEEGYTFKGQDFILGAGMLDGEGVEGLRVKLPLKSFNRHGLIAGATGTGKTKSMQVIAEQLSESGVPCLLMDLKGDLSGLAMGGSNNKHIEKRHGIIQTPWESKAMPLEFLTISNGKGVKLRATVTEFGPVLFSKILELNDTQQGIISLVFKYCDDSKLPLIDLKDMKKVLHYITNDGKKEIQEEFGRVSTASVSTILRKIIELEQQGAETFFGEKSFEVEDFTKLTAEGKGKVSVLRLTDIQDRPKLFSTFMLSLLAEIYATFPEEGDLDKPKLCVFIDEAHLIFNNASSALLQQLEAIVKLIRSKGVGVFFVTQNPSDVPEAVLSQLGLKVQHALRAFTAKDRRNIKRTSENYPDSKFYKTDSILTNLGIGEALITGLNEKGIPTPLVATLMRAPMSRMDILTDKEIDEVVRRSELTTKYNDEIDRESAYELLKKKLEDSSADDHKAEIEEQKKKAKKVVKEKGMFEELTKNTMVRQMGRTVMREISRGLLGMLGINRSSRRR
ncbi:MAG: DNA helicase HerA-like ATPase [Patiriisocius sp.]|jgi:DNA helicase HerA-like ATPase